MRTDPILIRDKGNARFPERNPYQHSRKNHGRSLVHRNWAPIRIPGIDLVSQGDRQGAPAHKVCGGGRDADVYGRWAAGGN